MATRWTSSEEKYYYDQLWELYIVQNKTIFETAAALSIRWQTVFQRLKRLGIPTRPEKKKHYLAKRNDIKIPSTYSDDLAEFFGIMLGDGHLSHFQVTVTLGTKEMSYAEYVAVLMSKIFGPVPKISVRERGHKVVYLGSTDASHWLKNEGLVFHKVKSQVDVPRWISTEESYTRRFVRGFFDTDGSVYKLRYGIQISFTNHSLPLLTSLQQLCEILGYRVSAISGWRFYITKMADMARFFREVNPQNQKHQKRYATFIESYQKMRK